MGVIPILDFESVIQTGDLTRLNAKKSIKTNDVVPEIASMLIAPGVQPAIQVYNADPKRQNLDWVWEDWNWDIDATKNKIYFIEAGVEKTATVPALEYTLATLIAAIKTAMDAAGSQVYTVTKSLRNEITVSSTGIFGLRVRGKDAALLSILGFKFDSESDKATFTGDIVDRSRRKIVLTVATGAPAVTAAKTYYVELLTPDSDYLFSSDQDLLAEEPDILNWVPRGRATHLNVHRRAQDHIIDWLDRQGYRDDEGNTLTKWNVVDRGQVKLWSQYLALKFIFQSIHNSVDDVFQEKAAEYEKLEIASRNRTLLELGFSKDAKEKGKVEKDKSPSSWSGTLYRR